MGAVFGAIKPVLLAFIQTQAVKQLVVDLLGAYARTTGNTIDDGIVRVVRQALGLAE